MLNGAHLHLILNHLPITAFSIASVLTLVAVFKRHLRRLALMGIVLAALLTLPAYVTGGAAEDIVESYPNLMVSSEMMLAHAQAAQWAMIAAAISGLLAAAVLWLPLITATIFRRLYPVAMIVCLWATSVMLTTGFLGGKIHHPEITSPQ